MLSQGRGHEGIERRHKGANVLGKPVSLVVVENVALFPVLVIALIDVVLDVDCEDGVAFDADIVVLILVESVVSAVVEEVSVEGGLESLCCLSIRKQSSSAQSTMPDRRPGRLCKAHVMG